MIDSFKILPRISLFIFMFFLFLSCLGYYPAQSAEPSQNLEQELTFRLGYQIVQPESMNSDLPDQFHIKDVIPFGADWTLNDFAVLMQKLFNTNLGFPLRIGLRFERLSSLRGHIIKDRVDLSTSRWALTLGHHWTYSWGSSQQVNKPQIFFIGPLVSVGFFHLAKIDTVFDSGPKKSFKAQHTQSASIAVEAGVRMDCYVLGAEMGYQALNSYGYRDAQGRYFSDARDQHKTADLSGGYVKTFFGFAF